jgi:hypothetical protein
MMMSHDDDDDDGDHGKIQGKKTGKFEGNDNEK